MSFAHMKIMVTANGGTTRGAKIHDGQALMANQFNTDLSYRDTYYFWKFGKESKDFVQLPIKVFHQIHSEAIGFTKKFNCLYTDYPVIGDVLYDAEEKLYWLVTESYDNDNILRSGKMVRMNNWIKWQDKQGNIYEYPVYDHNTTQYNSGVSGSTEILLGSSQHILEITADENTLLIDHDMRYFLDRNTVHPTVFKVTQSDTTDKYYDKGILKITLSEDEYNPEKDRIDLWLCDYIEPKALQDIVISYDGNPTVGVGTMKVFTASENAAFNLDISETLSRYVSVAPISDNACAITVTLYQRIVGEKLVLRATAGEKTGELQITITGGV